MTEKKNTLRFIFLGFIVAIFVTVLMCGVTIRQEIVRVTTPQRNMGNTAGRARGSGVPRRYPVAPAVIPPPAAKPPEAPTPGLFHWGSASDASYERLKPYAGTWEGVAISDESMCRFKLEMRERAEAQGQFYGFSTIVCAPLLPNAKAGKLALGPNFIAAMLKRATHSAILSGTPAKGAIAFHIDKTIGNEDCALTGVTITPFGRQLLAEWQTSGCPAGQLLLERTGR